MMVRERTQGFLQLNNQKNGIKHWLRWDRMQKHLVGFGGSGLEMGHLSIRRHVWSRQVNTQVGFQGKAQAGDKKLGRNSSVQFSCSVASDSLRPHELQHARPPCPSPTPRVHSDSSIESVMPSSHLIFCRPLLLLPPIPPSIRVFSNESTLRMRWPKYWSFSFSIIPSKEIPGLISFRMDLLDLLAVQGTLKSLLQHHSSKASILRRSAFFTVQFSHPYMATGKTIALTRWTSVGKVMSLLLNMLSRLVITFLPRSKRLLISWLQSPSAMILEPIKIKSDTVSTVSPSISHEVMGPDAMIFILRLCIVTLLI